MSGDDNPSRSGMRTSVNGGAGAAFYFERTGSGTDVVSEYLPWEYKQKSTFPSRRGGFHISTLNSHVPERRRNGNR